MDGYDSFAGEFALLPIIPDDYQNNQDEIDQEQHKPFQSIHKRPTSFKAKHHPGIWFPAVPIHVKVIPDKRPVHRIHSNLYKVDITHGDFSWTIYRRYKHIRYLHEQLRLFLATCKIPMPTKQHRERRRSMREEKSALPRFPLLPDQFVREENIHLRAKQLEDYLQNILQFKVYRNHIETLTFLEVSYLSFLKEFGPKRTEGMIKKRVGSCSMGCLDCTNFFHCGKSWRKRWLIVKDTFLTFIRPKDGAIRDVLLLDGEFRVKAGFHETGIPHGIIVKNAYRELQFSCWTHRKQVEWAEQIQQVIDGVGKEFIRPKRLDSFAPVRTDSIARWFVDGDIYFESVADSLEAATEEIFITDWWLSPELYLKRIDYDRTEWRLDVVLERKAKLGVKIFILLYKEISLALGINSYYSKHKLMECPNIRVLRHPDHMPGGVYLWAHHEKLVVIDQKVAFLGGFDLCYGRWDEQNHRLDDLGNNALQSANNEPEVIEESPKLSKDSPVPNITMNGNSLDISTPVIHLLGSKDTINSANQDQLISENTEIISLSSEGTNASSIILDKLKQDIPQKDDLNNSAHVSPLVTLSKPGLSSVAMSLKCEQLWRNKAMDRRALYSQHKKMSLCRSFSTGADVLDKGPLKCYSRNKSVLEASNRSTYENILDRYNHLEKNLVPSPPEIAETGNNNSTEMKEMSATEKSSLIRRRWRLYLNVAKLAPPVNDQVTVGNIPGLDEKTANQKPSTPKSKRRFMDQCISNCPWSGGSLENKSLISSTESQPSESALENAAKIWIGKDYCNFICKDFVDLESPFEDMIDRTTTPRMPWHDIGMVVYGKAAQDVARHFIQRWNVTKVKKVRNDSQYPFLFPKINSAPMNKQTTGKMTLQVLRSVSQWSAGIQKPENSIHDAYVECIQNAKHFIYIENQFFISKASKDSTVLNKINEALFQRILRAHCDKQTFRVYVVMPLLPAFEGELGTNKGTAIQAVTHWNYSSICRGDDSLLVKLKHAGVLDPFNYITFYGLRNHGELVGKLTTELVYVHSKMLIVDDDTTIIGSANINDRSMLGVRDSEIAVMVQDLEKFSVEFDGKEHLAGYFSSSLRRTLFREHLGIPNDDHSIDLSDPICDSFYKEIWIRQASINTSIYEKVFRCVPSDHVLTFDDLRRYTKEAPLSDTNPDEARKLLNNVQGHVVLIPLLFLEKECLTPSAGSKEALLPTILWT